MARFGRRKEGLSHPQLTTPDDISTADGKICRFTS